MKFSDWKVLYESLSKDHLAKEADKVKTLVDELKDFYAVPDFDTFKRPGEPEQQSNLFTNDKLNTFSANYTSKGILYSLDFWKSTDTKPRVTYYVSPNVSIEDIAAAIPLILDKPNKQLAPDQIKNATSKVLQEDDDESIKLTLDTHPKSEISLDPDVKKAEQLVGDDYDYGNPDTIFDDLKLYVDMIIKKVQPSLIITGSPGVGKTYTVLKQLNNSNLEKDKDYIHVKGRSTSAGMFITLYENNGKIIVFDDCDSVFKSEDAVNILKGALDSNDERKISWLTGRPLKTSTGRNIPPSFIFDGHVIFISNLPQRKIDNAIKSRSFVIEVALTPDDMIMKMRADLSKIAIDIPMAYKREALDLIETAAESSLYLEVSMRTLIKAIKILRVVDNLKLAKRLIMQQCSYK